MAKRTIIDLFEEAVAKYSEKTFLLEKLDKQFEPTTYAAVKVEALRIGAGLAAMGVTPKQTVSILAEGCNNWIISELGLLYAGAISVPLSIKLEEANDLLFRLRHADVTTIFVSKYQLPKIRKIKDQLPLVERIIVFQNDVALEEKEYSLDAVKELGDKYLSEHRDQFLAISAAIENDDYATITYTSGTTADPKGVVLTHRNYTANVEQALTRISIPSTYRTLIILPLDHCFAHVAGFYTMMYYGGSIATVPVGKTAIATLKNIPIAIKEVKPMLMLSVPALARNFRKNIETGVKAKGAFVERLYEFALQNAIKYNKEYWNRGGWQAWRWPLVKLFDKIIFKAVREGMGGRLKFFVGGGALLDIELQRYFCAVGMPMFQGYGLSEATPIICANSDGHAIFGSSGRIVSPLDLKICDEDGNEVPHGQKGEIVIKGENVMAGYWKNPESTAKTIVDGWLHTGDMGYVTDKHPGYLWVVGRFKSLLISADGEKYSPEGFEDSLTDGSKYIEQVILHNNQDPYTMVLIVPNKDALKEYVKAQGMDATTEQGKKAMLQKIQDEVNEYRNGKFAGMFPEQWLPKAIAVLPEAFTEQNHMVNSTMKIVRGKVEEYYADRIEYAYTAEGKELMNEKNMASL